MFVPNSLPLILLAFLLISCGAKRDSSAPIGPSVQIEPPLGLPKLDIPHDNPPTAATIALGRRLYYDTRLSVDSSLSCASCHNPKFGFADGRRVSRGVGDKLGTRSAPSVLNAAYYPMQFWDGRAKTLEDQAAGPIANPIEMNQSHDACVDRLNDDPNYVSLFEAAFGPGPVSMSKVQKSIASFERTLLSGNSPFDRYQYGGDKNALGPSAVRGLEIFKDKNRGNCAVCHPIGERDALFSDGKFHNIGSGIDPNGELTDLGRYHETKLEPDKGAFKTPTLRNIALTAPYMHDGSKKTLKAVIDFYVGGGTSNPHLDKEIKELTLSGQERADLVAFLESLTGQMPPDSGPPDSK